MRKTHFQKIASRVASEFADLEKERSMKNGGGHAVTSVVLYESSNCFLESAQN